MTFQEFLKQLSLFKDLSDAEINQLAPLCRLVEGKADDRLVREGMPVRSIFFLLSGQAVVMKGVDAKKSIIGDVQKGAIIGELSLYDNTDASATVQATEPFKALAIDSAKFLQLMESNHSLGYKVFKKLARNTSRRFKMMSGEHAECLAVPDEPAP
jgi:CRP/FNR family transcriptional regulator, cyclic AMP receptor protein